MSLGGETLMLISKLRICGYAILVVLVGAGTIWGLDHYRQAVKVQLAAHIATLGTEIQTATTERDAYRSQAEGFLADLNQLKATATTQAQEIARLRTQHPQILEAPQGVPDPCPDLRALAVQQDGLIQTQGLQLGTWEQRGAALQGQASASDRVAQLAVRQVQTLQVQLAGIATDRPWSVGPLMGVNAQGQLRFGVIASGTYSRVQGHALILGDTAALGVTFRFGGGK